MIRSTKCSIKFANSGRKKEYLNLIEEYRKACVFFVDKLWDRENLSKFVKKEDKEGLDTWLSYRMISSASIQAVGIIRTARSKYEKRVYTYKKLLKEGNKIEANKLLKFIEKNKISKPKLNIVNPALHSNFLKIDDNNDTSFDIWLTLKSITPDRKRISIPIKKTKHFNKLLKAGEVKYFIRIKKSEIIFTFDIPDKEDKKRGKTIGLDMGITNIYTCSNGIASTKDLHGHDLSNILNKISRKEVGSKGFKRAQNHRTNYINWSIKQLNLKGVKELRVEDIKGLYTQSRKDGAKKVSHWAYAEIKDKITARCEESGVRLLLKPYAYSSQRCSQCGWTQKANRQKKFFVCKNCNYAEDADINAAVNIGLDLPKIPWAKMRQKDSDKGFFYAEQECIVPVVKKNK